MSESIIVFLFNKYLIYLQLIKCINTKIFNKIPRILWPVNNLFRKTTNNYLVKYNFYISQL